MTQVTSMISQGVFDRYPDLRVAYLEAGCGWVPYIMDVMDEQFGRKGASDLKRKPSEYLLADNIYFSFEIEERTPPFFIQTVGDTKLVWPSDYPHERPRNEFFSDLPAFFAREDVSAQSKRRILSENPKRLYRI